MRVPLKMRASSKRSAVIGSAVVVVAAFDWNRTRSSQHAEIVTSKKSPLGATATVRNSENTFSDSENDRFPDLAELRTFEDRESFRRWFTNIAETQIYQLSDQWKKNQRDS